MVGSQSFKGGKYSTFLSESCIDPWHLNCCFLHLSWYTTTMYNNFVWGKILIRTQIDKKQAFSARYTSKTHSQRLQNDDYQNTNKLKTPRVDKTGSFIILTSLQHALL